jgi:DNA-binding MarR family transcriptional regulator
MRQPTERQTQRIAKRKFREERNLLARMPAAYAASRLQGQRMLQSAGGLSIVEWRVLWDLVEAGPMTIREMAEIQRIDHSQLSRALPKMRRTGLVEMRQDNSDGRQILVTITPYGEQAYDMASPVMQRRREALRAIFSEIEMTQFIELLGRLEDFCRQPIDQIIEAEPAQ